MIFVPFKSECPSAPVVIYLITATFVLAGGGGFHLHPATAQSRKEKQDQVLAEVSDIYLKMRTAYQDTYHDLQRLQQFREQGVDSGKISSLQQKISNRLKPTIRDLNTRLKQLDPASRQVRNIVQAARNIFKYFKQYAKKSLYEQELTEAERRRRHRYPQRQRLKKGLASPKELKQAFLGGLMSQMKRWGLMKQKNPWRFHVSRLDVLSFYWRILETYIEEIQEIYEIVDQLRKERKQKSNQDQSGNRDGNVNPDSDTARSNGEDGNREHDILFEKEPVRKRISKAGENWNSFWEKFHDDWKKDSRKLERQLILYRDLRHKDSSQKRKFRQALAIKKFYTEILKLRKDDVFRSEKKIESFLLMLSDFYLNRFNPVLSGHRQKILRFYGRIRVVLNKRLLTFEDKEDVTKEKQAKQKKKVVASRLDAYEGSFQSSLEKIQRIRYEELNQLATLLNERFPKKKKENRTTPGYDESGADGEKTIAEGGENQQSSGEPSDDNARSGNGTEEATDVEETQEKNGEQKTEEPKHPYGRAIRKISSYTRKLEAFAGKIPSYKTEIIRVFRDVQFESVKQFRSDVKERLKETSDKMENHYEDLQELWNTIEKRLKVLKSENASGEKSKDDAGKPSGPSSDASE